MVFTRPRTKERRFARIEGGGWSDSTVVVTPSFLHRTAAVAQLDSRPSASEKPRVPQRTLTIFVFLLLALVPGLPSSSHADVGQRLSRLTHLSDEAVRAGVPFGYVPLRQIWAEYDQGDPAEVEETLRALAVDRRLAAPLRSYAGLLEAYSRRRRGDLTGAKARVKDLGFVGRWNVVGPFDNEGKGGLDRAFGPEEDVADPLNLSKTYEAKERPATWRLAPDVFPYAWVDLGSLVRPAEKVCAYATTFVRDPRAKNGPRAFSLWFGSAGASKVWFDGQVVLKDAKYRDLDTD